MFEFQVLGLEWVYLMMVVVGCEDDFALIVVSSPLTVG
jgi:hypothetical protein